MLEKAIKVAVKDGIKEKALPPNEKLLKTTVSQIKSAVKIPQKLTDGMSDSLSTEKKTEIKAAKDYFRGINDTERLNALEGTDELKKEEALMEVKEKQSNRLSYSDWKKVRKLNRKIDNIERRILRNTGISR